MIKIILGKLITSKASLEKLVDLEVPISTSFKIMDFVQKINPYLENYQIQQKRLFDLYGDRDNKIIHVHMDAYAKDLEILMNEEVEIDFKPFDLTTEEKKIEVFGRKSELSVRDLMGLEYLFLLK